MNILTLLKIYMILVQGGFAISPNLTYYYNYSNIIGINNSDNFDAENNQCQCGAGRVFFILKINVLMIIQI